MDHQELELLRLQIKEELAREWRSGQAEIEKRIGDNLERLNTKLERDERRMEDLSLRIRKDMGEELQGKWKSDIDAKFAELNRRFEVFDNLKWIFSALGSILTLSLGLSA